MNIAEAKQNAKRESKFMKNVFCHLITWIFCVEYTRIYKRGLNVVYR